MNVDSALFTACRRRVRLLLGSYRDGPYVSDLGVFGVVVRHAERATLDAGEASPSPWGDLEPEGGWGAAVLGN